MRFFKDGPSIPDELLNARDEARVVFFCGAGVSRARAGLADFFGLADEVISALGVQGDSPVHKILGEAREIEERTGVGGLISVDRIFGLLEREFDVNDIRSAVANSLRPKPEADLSAHRILLDLAKTPNGKTRLVTTNFDRLFSDCDSSLAPWQPPRLPDPSRPSEMDGIIHLHGRATEGYDGAEEDGFVLSSSDFGRAYLSEAWATKFFREILERYIVVFVGYTADDPPVQYLLEALNIKGSKLTGVYAFQAGAASIATSRWLHKGVEAIPYAPDNGHQALWETLAAWAERAKSPENWYQSVIAMAQKNPEQLEAHERGQVAHLVKTPQGAARFSSAKPPPPAEWLCVLDQNRRFAKPGHIRINGEQGLFANPFDLYGLDTDPIPNRGESRADEAEERDKIKDRWDAFALNRLDHLNLSDGNLPAIRGHWAINQASLSARLRHLGFWIGQVAHQPACVWWAAHQGGLHPEIEKTIDRELNHSGIVFLPHVRAAWRYLFETWSRNPGEDKLDWYRLKSMLEKHGWSSIDVREYAAASRPFIKVQPNFWGAPIPPQSTANSRVGDFLDIDVEYGQNLSDILVPDEWLESILRELRKNLEHAIDLENEIGGYGLSDIVPLLQKEVSRDALGQLHGLSSHVAHFTALFERLTVTDIVAAKRELASWQPNDDTVFARLRIWASSKPELIDAAMFGAIMAQMNEIAFWDSYHQPDLLMALARRWSDLPETTRSDIGYRLLRGPLDSDGMDKAKFAEHAAWASLNRLHWLAAKKCIFSFDLNHESQALQKLAPDWKTAYAESAAESMSARGGMVRTEIEHASLLKESLDSLLKTAQEQSGRGIDFLVENDPFSGLCLSRPVRAFNALTYAAKHGDFPEWAWRKFLNSDARKNDRPKLVALIAHRLSSYEHKNLLELIRPISEWLLLKSELLSAQFPAIFDKLVFQILEMLQQHPAASNSAIIRGQKDPDWAAEALNAPSGKIAQALMNDARKYRQSPSTGLEEKWLERVSQLLALPGDARRHGLVLFSFNLNWFYAHEPTWTEDNILSVLDQGSDDDRSAVWSGFFWGAKTPHDKLYVRLKPHLLTIAIKGSWSKKGYAEVLAAMTLMGWASTRQGSNEQFVSDGELQEVLLNSSEEFRSRVLWLIGRWSKDRGEAEGINWFDRLLHLLRSVWPRQLSAKTPAISAILCNLPFENPERFSELTPVVLPLLTRIDLDHLSLHGLYQSGEDIARLHPDLTLALLSVVLPDEVRAWPYEIEKVLAQITDSNTALKVDDRMIELNRKWNAR